MVTEASGIPCDGRLGASAGPEQAVPDIGGSGPSRRHGSGGRWRPVVGGMVVVAGGILGFSFAVLLLANIYDYRDHSEYEFFQTLSLAVMLLSLVTVAGGVSAIVRRHFKLAVAGGVLSLLAFFYILSLLGLAVGLAGIVLILISKDEFG